MVGLCLFEPETAFAQEPSDGPILTFELAGSAFKIPRNYFLPGPPREGKVEDLLVHALMPSMQPMREDNKNEFLYPNPKGHGKTVNILIKDAQRTTDIEFRLNVEKKNAGPYDSKPSLYGLQVLLPTDMGPDDRRRRMELYIAGADGRAVSFVGCYRDYTVPYPVCADTFSYQHLLIQADYGKGYLPEWRTIEHEIISLIDQFKTQTAR
jgi:hypothetical protein